MGRYKIQTSFIILLLILIPLVSPLAFKQNQEGDIKHAVRLNDGLPNSDVKCNITIINPDKQLITNFAGMTRADLGQYYNFTLNSTQTSLIGAYDYDITCISPTYNKTESFEFYVNQGGIEPSTTKTDTITRTTYFIGIIGLIFFLSFVFSRNQNPTYKFTYLILSLICFLITMNVIFIGLQDDLVNPNIQNLFSFLTSASFYLMWGLGIMLGFLWIVATINTFLIKNNEKYQRRFGYED